MIASGLRRDGKIPLVELVKVSGVKKQHDYAGIGSTLTRNMKKAGGPKKDWYDGNQDVHGDWNYEIAGELVRAAPSGLSNCRSNLVDARDTGKRKGAGI